MSLHVEESPERKKTKNPSPPLSLSSLPDDITVNCLARISRSYYPRCSLVSKTFNSFLSSTDLYAARSRLGLTEQSLYLCLADHYRQFPQWLRLWINPHKKNGQLVPIPNSNFPALEKSTLLVGSEIYVIGGPTEGAPSSAVGVLDCLTNKWRNAPSMSVARENALLWFHDGKIYVVGGYKGFDNDEPWVEVLDVKTQTWESRDNPCSDIHRFIMIRIAEMEGKVYVVRAYNMYTYDLKRGDWELIEDHTRAIFAESGLEECVVENVSYKFGFSSFYKPISLTWCDVNDGMCNDVKGLDWIAEKYRTDVRSSIRMTRLVKSGGKLLLVWQEDMPRKTLFWCAEIVVDKRSGGEVWGSVEWADVVHSVPDSSYLFHCLVVTI